MSLFNRILKVFSQIAMYVAVLALVLLVGLNLYEVTFRYLFNKSNYWIQDTTLLLMMWVLFMGMVKIVFDKQDVFVDLLVNVFPAALKKICSLIVNAVSLVFISRLFYYGVMFMKQRAGRNTITAEIPCNLYTLAMQICCVLMDLIFIRNIWELVAGKTCDALQAKEDAEK